MKTTIALLLLALVSTANASSTTYYSAALLQKISKGALKDDALKTELNGRISQNQTVLGYDGARKILFGKIHLEQNGSKYFIKDVYCHKIFAGGDVRPGAIPNHAQINCEHTWPQSKFTGAYPKEMQKSDLHHLYPTDSKANSVRGNFDFAEISHESGALNNCDASKSGSSNSSSDSNLFEPPTEHKGNVARALFYFSVRYKIKIPAAEEQFLRRWNDIDPVDDAEMSRNDAIEEVQGNRNPFIDFPQLANYINKF